MKVLYFMNHVGTGGAALALYDLVKELKEELPENYDPVVITGRKSQLNKVLTDLGIENYTASYKNFLTSTRKPAFLFRLLLQVRYILSKPFAIRKIEKLIDFKKIDIIHSNLNRIDIGYYFSKKYKIPHVWHIREHGNKDFITAVFPSYKPLFADTTSTFIAISKSVKTFWISEGMQECNIELIYDGVEPKHWLQKKESIKYSELSFIFLGGYDKNKGQEIFIEALRLLPADVKKNIRVDFYGNGSKSLKKILSDLLKKYQLEDICTLHDYNPDIYSILEKYHAGVNCSKYEGFGRVTVEYMMAGLCPVVSNCTANTEIVEDNCTGIIFDRENLLDLSEKIIYLYNNRNELKRLSVNARLKANESFTIKSHALNVYNLYKNADR